MKATGSRVGGAYFITPRFKCDHFELHGPVGVVLRDLAAPLASELRQPRVCRRPRRHISPARHLLQESEILTEGTFAKEPAASSECQLRENDCRDGL